MKTFLKGERKKVEHSIYTLEFVDYIDHIIDNLNASRLKKVISYNRASAEDSIHIEKIINIDNNHFKREAFKLL